MDLQIEQQQRFRITSKDDEQHVFEPPSRPEDLVDLASRYLSLALADGTLSDDEKAVHEALEQLVEQGQDSPAALALGRFVFGAQRSGGQLTAQERELIQELADALEADPEGKAPGMQGLLDLLNDLSLAGTPGRELTPAELDVAKRLLRMVRSGKFDAPTIDKILQTVHRLALEGAHLYEGLYTGFTPEDGAQVGQQVHQANAEALLRLLDGAVDLPTLLQQPPEVLEQLLAKDPAQVKALLKAGFSLPVIAAMTDAQAQALLKADPVVVQALLGAGMSAADAARLAGTVTRAEAASPAFIDKLREKLAAGVKADDAILWARFSGLATDTELSDPAFLKDLAEAGQHGHGATATDSLHYARAQQLFRRLDGTVPLDTLMGLDDAALARLSAIDPAQLKQLAGLGLTVPQLAQLSTEQRAALLKADPAVVRALLGAGMKLDDVLAYMGTVTGAEAASPAFVNKLREKLAAGVPAGDAILWARFSGLATDAELSDPAFLKDLAEAGLHGHGGSATEALQYARDQAIARGIHLDPDTIQRLTDMGLSMSQIAQLSEAERNKLLSGDENYAWLVHNLLGTGMNVHDVVAYAGTVVTAKEATLEFLAKLRQHLQQPGTSGAAAIAAARYGDQLTPEELANPDFLHDLLYAGNSWDGARQGQLALTLLQSLDYARQHVDVFEAAEKVAAPGSNPHNKWFANAGVFQLAGMKTDSAEWAQIEATLGRPLSKEERQAAIDAAKGLADNWSTLCGMAKDIGLTLREGTTDVLDFTQDNLDKLNTSPLVAKLGDSPTLFGLTGMNIISALDYARNHVDIFEAAEKVAVPSSASDNGWFANAGVFQLAGMKTDSAEWHQIELTLGHTLSNDERQKAIDAAKSLTENWSTLCAKAGELGLNLRKGTTDVLDFKRDELKHLNLAPLASMLGAPTAADATNALKYARAKQLEAALRGSDGQPTPGADLDTLLKLSPDEINRLSKLDPAKVRPLIGQRPLSEIAQLTPAQLDAVSQVPADLLRYLLSLTDDTLAEISKLTTGDLGELQKAMNQGYRKAGPQEDFNDILPDSISHPINLDGGMLIFQTKSGQKIIVTKNSNTDLYNKVSEMLQTRTQGEIDAIRKQFGLPPSAEVDVMSLPSNVLNDKDKPDSGYMTVGQLTIKTLIDKYREMIKKGEITHDDKRAQLVRAFEAANALGHGYKLLPYYENPNGFGTYRTYPGGEDNPTFQDMSPEDVEALLNEGKVSERIGELLQDPTIQADYQSSLNSAVNTLPNKQALIDKLYNALTGSAYTDALKALKDKGLSYEAEQMTQRDLASLAMLDPAKAAEAGQKLRINSLDVDFQSILNDPSLIDSETFTQATTDAIAIVIQALRSSSSLVRHGSQTAADMIKYLEEVLGDKKSVTALSDTIKQLVIDAKQGKTVNLANITQAQFDEAMAKANVPLELRGGLSGFFGTTQKFGVWGSIGGAAALASFGYKLSKGAWGPNSTALERWGAARDIISFLSVIGHVAKSGAGFVDFARTLLGADPNSQLAWKALGLDRTLPQVWGKESFLPGERPWVPVPDVTPGPVTIPDTPGAPPNTPRNSGEFAQSFADEFDDIFRNYDETFARNWESLDLSANEKLLAQEAADHLAEIWKTAAPEALTKLGSLAQRIGVSALKVLGTVTDLAGIADIVVGALGLKKAIDANDVGGIVSNSLGIAGGAALTAAGVIGTAGLFATVPAAIAAAAAPLFLAGAVLALGGFVVAMIVQAVKRHNHLQDASNDQGQWFRDLANDGLAYADWGDKLEFLRYSFAIYGNDNPDPSKSYFEYQKAEWEHFQHTPGKDGSSLNRLDRDLHVSNDKTWEDPFKYDDSGYAVA